MKTASILLAFVVVMGCQPKPKIWGYTPRRDCTILIGDYRYGFVDFTDKDSAVFAGPLGDREVPFTATQGLVGFGLILAMLIIVPVVLSVRWKKKRAT